MRRTCTSRHLLGAAASIIVFARLTLAADAPSTQPISVPATIEAFEQTDLVAKASGYIAEVKADIGDHVKTGQLLAAISAPELDNDVAEAKATHAAKVKMLASADALVVQAQQAVEVSKKQHESERAALQLEEITLKRQQELAAGKAVTEQQLDETKSKFEIAKAAVAVAEAKVGSADAELQGAQANRDVAAAQIDVAAAQLAKAQTLQKYTQITAPFDGVISKRLVNRGDLVQTTRAAPLYVLQRIDTVRVMCDVPESAASRVRTGTPASLKLYGQAEALPATVSRTSLSLNPETRTMRAEIDLKNPDEKLLPGMYVQVILTPPAPGAVVATPQR